MKKGKVEGTEKQKGRGWNRKRKRKALRRENEERKD